jgi:hypothetical protein
MKQPCKFCSEHCGNDWCSTLTYENYEELKEEFNGFDTEEEVIEEDQNEQEVEQWLKNHSRFMNKELYYEWRLQEYRKTGGCR